MQADSISEQRLLQKIRQLPPEKVLLVEDFIDSLDRQNTDRSLTFAAAKLSEPVLLKIWDNPDDVEYDKL
ncbi:MAG: toxin-antitoxin system, antitoxin component, Xre family protein [Nostoc sp. DedVER02]|uniref:toxin-antitoxin system, antitoxin component, Xre family protein n=1 Tax=Nostoc sp. DedVER02 TaxID=3075405 RepID=UPI002AD4630F|nr:MULTISPECIES: toxin-antitoxin system, antitoxin component, Xre family protein [unclassified Nostoc]MDZ7985175.1 toxin-antitoxin system, antitoxin component, Xre family protein [Nostoc sp. DedVER02]MDZ8115113.1 toxin-antitoxin system, antitoxin component, Xre family protein [Nostoc sp. DedVER01b]